MSTKLHDLARQAVLGVGLTPRTATGNVNGPPGDLLAGDGRCFAIQQVGTVGGTAPTLAGKIQESADGTTWSDIPGATFTTVSTNDNVQAITFDRTQPIYFTGGPAILRRLGGGAVNTPARAQPRLTRSQDHARSFYPRPRLQLHPLLSP